MFPPPAVHSFNPRRHSVEELYGHQPLLCSALFITQRLSCFALCYFHSERKNRELICTVVLHREQKWSRDEIIQLKIQGGMIEGQEVTCKNIPGSPSLRGRWRWVWTERPSGRPFKLNKNTTCGCGCADWSKLSSSKLSAFGTSHHHNMRYSPSSSCRVLLNTRAPLTPTPCDSVDTMWLCGHDVSFFFFVA